MNHDHHGHDEFPSISYIDFPENYHLSSSGGIHHHHYHHCPHHGTSSSSLALASASSSSSSSLSLHDPAHVMNMSKNASYMSGIINRCESSKQDNLAIASTEYRGLNHPGEDLVEKTTNIIPTSVVANANANANANAAGMVVDKMPLESDDKKFVVKVVDHASSNMNDNPHNLASANASHYDHANEEECQEKNEVSTIFATVTSTTASSSTSTTTATTASTSISTTTSGQIPTLMDHHGEALKDTITFGKNITNPNLRVSLCLYNPSIL